MKLNTVEQQPGSDEQSVPIERRSASLRARVLRRRDTKVGRAFDRFIYHESTFLLVILGGLVLLFTLLSPPGSFFSSANFQSISLDTAEILVLAAGEMYIIVAAGLDLSVGSLVVFSSVVCAKVLTHVAGTAAAFGGSAHHLALAIAAGIFASIIAGAAWGTVNGVITARFHVPPFVVTLGTLGMALGFAQIITGGLNVGGIPAQLENFGAASFLGVPWLVVIAGGVVAVMWVVLAQTRYGLTTYALGASEEATRRAGVNVFRHTASLYILLGVLAGIVGFMDVTRFGTASIAAHTQDNLNAIAAVVIGGTSLYGGRGHMSGTIIGAFIPAVLRNGFILIGVQPFWQNVAVGGVLILAVYVDQRRRASRMRSARGQT